MAKNVGEGWSEKNPFTPRDTIKNGIALSGLIAMYNCAGIRWEIYLNLYTGITPELDLIYMGMGITREKAV